MIINKFIFRFIFTLVFPLSIITASVGCKDRQEKLQEKVAKLCLEANKETPYQLDKDIRVDSILPNGSSGVLFKLTITSIDKSEIKMPLEELTAGLKKYVSDAYRKDPETQCFYMNNITIRYEISDKYGELISDFSVSPNLGY